MAYQADDP